jgi:hypothetical protein
MLPQTAALVDHAAMFKQQSDIQLGCGRAMLDVRVVKVELVEEEEADGVTIGAEVVMGSGVGVETLTEIELLEAEDAGGGMIGVEVVMGSAVDVGTLIGIELDGDNDDDEEDTGLPSTGQTGFTIGSLVLANAYEFVIVN